MKNILLIWTILLSQLSEYDQMKLVKHYYENSFISILGDSISTYDGYSNDALSNASLTSNHIFYDDTVLSDVSQTWWKEAMNQVNMQLLVNNASSATTMLDEGYLRAKQLHNDTNPDIIIIFMGINDLNYYDESYLGSFDEKVVDQPTTFAQAYQIAVEEALKQGKEVFCCTLYENSKTKELKKEQLLIKYNEVIKQIATYYDCEVIDFYNESTITYESVSKYTFDGIHPNELGMDLLSEVVVDSLKEKAIKKYGYEIEQIWYHIISKTTKAH